MFFTGFSSGFIGYSSGFIGFSSDFTGYSCVVTGFSSVFTVVHSFFVVAFVHLFRFSSVLRGFNCFFPCRLDLVSSYFSRFLMLSCFLFKGFSCFGGF